MRNDDFVESRGPVIRKVFRPGGLMTLAAGVILAGSIQVARAQGPDFEWARKMGGTGFDQSLAIKADRAGNSYTAGFYAGTADFGTYQITSNGVSDGFFASCDRSGEFRWVRNLGGGLNDEAQHVAVDGRGNVYVAGSFFSSDFRADGAPSAHVSAGQSDVFVVKYDSLGNYRWSVSLGGSNSDYSGGIAVDTGGNVYVAGYFSSPDFNPGSSANLLSSSGSGDLFLVKLDASGNYVWAKSMSCTNGGTATDLTVDQQNHIYLTGFFNGSLNTDPNGSNLLGSTGVSDIFVAKYDTGGNHIWARRMGGTGDDYGRGVATDRDGNVFLGGTMTQTATFDGTTATVTTAGARDIILAKYDAAGNYLWAKNIGGTGSDEGFSVAADGAGNVYITGVFQATVDLATGVSLTAIGTGSDVLVVKYDPAGDHMWSRSAGGSAFERGKGISVGGGGHVFLTGHFLSNPADFNPGGTGGSLVAASADGFVVKYGCANPTSSRLTVNVCATQYSLNGYEYTASGSYTQVIANKEGCDSTITLDLTLYNLEPRLTVQQQVLGLTGTYATYQWIKDGADIQGATQPTYTITENGRYAARVTNEDNCEATTEEYLVTNLSVSDMNGVSGLIRIHPNPAQDLVHIVSPVPVTMKLTGMDGRMLLRTSGAQALDVHDLPAGMYLLHIADHEGRLIKTEKLLKQ